MEFKKSKCMLCKKENIIICVYYNYELCGKCYSIMSNGSNKFGLP